MDYIKKNINLNTNFLHDMRVNFKPSLLTRILLDGTSKEKVGGGKIMRGGAEDAKYFVNYEINPDLEIHDFIDEWMSRGFLKLFILNIAIYLAYVTVGIPAVRNLFFGNIDMEPQTDYSQPEIDNFKQKYLKIVLYLFVFILFTVIYSFILEKLPYIIIYIYYYYYKKQGDNLDFISTEVYELFFNKFPSKQGNGNMDFFNSMESYAVIGIFIYFVLYFFLVKSFITTMRYPEYTVDGEELPTEKKFIIYYSLTVIFTILFMMGMFAAHFAYRTPVNFVYMIIIIALYSLVVCYLYSFQLRRKKIMMIMMFVILFLIVLLNLFILQAK